MPAELDQGGWNEVITCKLFDFVAAGIGADGDSEITSTDVDGRPATSTIRLDSSSASSFFVDPTPFDNSEYTMNFVDASLGGGTANVGRDGSAVPGGPAEARTDVLTLLLHELAHSIGFNFPDRFDDLAGPVGSPNRKITVPASLSGLPSDFDLPILSNADHVDPFAAGGVFEHAITAEPSFDANDRWLPTGAELFALCRVGGCAANEINPALVGPLVGELPVPGSLWRLAAGLIPLVRRRTRLPV